MVKMDMAAVVRMLAVPRGRRGYIGAMPKFSLGGKFFEYAAPSLARGLEAHSWEYGHWPRVEAAVPLTGGGTVAVWAEASRWAGDFIHVRWQDGDEHYHQAWVPKERVRRLTASEWDIIEYQQCPPELRPVRWGQRLPGFLPE